MVVDELGKRALRLDAMRPAANRHEESGRATTSDFAPLNGPDRDPHRASASARARYPR
jgi:hypothetical protein